MRFYKAFTARRKRYSVEKNRIYEGNNAEIRYDKTTTLVSVPFY